MKHGLLSAACVLSFVSNASAACPAGQPAAPWPGPGFVPTTNCQGWVPRNHPLAMPDDPTPSAPLPVPPTGLMPPATLAAQGVYTALELPAQVSARAGGLTALRGWAVDCALGLFPPSLELREVKPDGSTRQIPNDYFWVPWIPRPDVQAAIGPACPAVYTALSPDPTIRGSNDFGWTLQLRTPITELGAHVFTVISAWPPQGHAGSSSVVVTIVP